ncbi:MAG: hypothetical protein LBE24_08815 [Methylobacillus sp.]|jgi:hypothetical protein|nr:hypothetical protein [Methylobacillus sp.]
MNALLIPVMILLLCAALLCFSVACFSTWIVSVGIARDEGREGTAIFMAITGALVGLIFLLRKQRYRQAFWIMKFWLGGLVSFAVLVIVMLFTQSLGFG